MAVTGYLTMGDGDLLPDFNVSETWQIVDSVTWTHGVHTFKAGIDFRRLRMDRAGANVPRGQFTFTGEITGNPAADFMHRLCRAIAVSGRHSASSVPSAHLCVVCPG